MTERGRWLNLVFKFWTSACRIISNSLFAVFNWPKICVSDLLLKSFAFLFVKNQLVAPIQLFN